MSSTKFRLYLATLIITWTLLMSSEISFNNAMARYTNETAKSYIPTQTTGIIACCGGPSDLGSNLTTGWIWTRNISVFRNGRWIDVTTNEPIRIDHSCVRTFVLPTSESHR